MKHVGWAAAVKTHGRSALSSGNSTEADTEESGMDGVPNLPAVPNPSPTGWDRSRCPGAEYHVHRRDDGEEPRSARSTAAMRRLRSTTI
jgi:hypothetical protein